MITRDRIFGRIRRFVATERWTVGMGSAAIVVAVLLGVVMGGPLLLGLLAVAVVVAAVGLMSWRNRHERLVGSAVGGVVGHFAVAALVVLAVAQLVPYGRSHSNPAVTGEPAWSSPETREFMVNSCFGCHSNEVEWPWYSNIAPVSWIVTEHVDSGRNQVNYSEFATNPGDAEETIEAIRERSMPPPYYTAFGLHPDAKLTDAEIDLLIAGLRLTPGMSEDGDSGGERSEARDDDDHEDDD